jgi:hypothetical protein
MTTYNFPPTSRYYGLETATIEGADGEPVPYLRRRMLPQSSRFALLSEHVVLSGQRIDQIAAAAFGDPELFWRLCDANDALHPLELTERIGRRLRITLPEGIPGISGS